MEYNVAQLDDDNQMLMAWDGEQMEFTTEDEASIIYATEGEAQAIANDININVGNDFVGARPIRRPH